MRALLLFPLALASAAEFETDILPILEARCAKCHSGAAAQAKLDVRSRALLAKGGASGPAFVERQPDRSALVQRIEAGQMPLGGPKLPATEIAKIRAWIAEGAPARNANAITAERKHWAFVTPVRPLVPKVSGRVRTPIDAFILEKLAAKKLTLNPDAEPATLARRVYFDLTGLPPTPAELDAFVADRAPDAYEHLVDRLLESPRYGERWGRIWLDAAGYADSEGVLAADVIRPNAWRYRDWVIRAVNADKPYDRFLQEQIAGDEVSEYWKHDRLPPEVIEKLEATGFLRTAVDATREDFLPKDFAEYQWRTFFDVQQIVATSVLGLTMQCSRCHDHKYEPFTQRDYFSMQALFAGAIRPDGVVLPSYKRQIVLATKEEKEHAARVNPPRDAAIKALRDLRTARINQYKASHPKGDKATTAELRAAFADYAARVDALDEEIKQEEGKKVMLPEIRALYDMDSAPPAWRILQRGDPTKPGEEVTPGVPAVLNDPAKPFMVAPPAKDAKTTGRRLQFAQWLTRADHPLTARVMMNRIWAGHFGTGIVETLENFGRSGAAPSNQALLDWLATEFIERRWSMKEMHRLILTSSVYRQSSQGRADGLAADPEDRLLWRMPPRRLEAEAVRDSILAVAGKLDLQMFGAPVHTDTKKTGEVSALKETESGRRSIYQIVRRSAPQSFLNAYDSPVMEINCTRRIRSTTATQALAMMNSDFLTAQARHFAARLEGRSPRESVEQAFRTILGRSPSASERDALLGFIDQQSKRYGGDSHRVYADLAQALMSTNEFVYVD